MLALGSMLSVVALAVGAAIEIASPTGRLSQAASSLLATALGASIGALAAYLGGRALVENSRRPEAHSAQQGGGSVAEPAGTYSGAETTPPQS